MILHTSGSRILALLKYVSMPARTFLRRVFTDDNDKANNTVSLSIGWLFTLEVSSTKRESKRYFVRFVSFVFSTANLFILYKISLQYKSFIARCGYVKSRFKSESGSPHIVNACSEKSRLVR